MYIYARILSHSHTTIRMSLHVCVHMLITYAFTCSCVHMLISNVIVIGISRSDAT